jgi:glutamyl-tRNA synthetase
MAQELGSGLGKVAQPVRVAVTGTPVSPPIDATLALLGRERSLARLDSVLEGFTAA